MMRIVRMEQMEMEVEVNENDIIHVSIDDTASIEVDAYPNRSFEGIVTEIANSADITGSGSAQQVTNFMVKIRITTPHNLEDNLSGTFIPASFGTGDNTREEPPRFKPGMSGTVDIRTKTVTNVVSVPIQAVTVRDFAELENRSNRSNNEDEQGESTISSDDLPGEGTETASPSGKEEGDVRRVVFLHVDGNAILREVETGISDNTHIQIMSGLSEGDEVVTGSYKILSRDLADGDKLLVENNK